MNRIINKFICPRNIIIKQVIDSLNEDLSTFGDKTASLIRSNHSVAATIKTNEDMIMCGQGWADTAFYVIDPDIMVRWHVADGEEVEAGASLCEVIGNARGILTAERTALNFMQTLSGTASRVRKYVAAVATTQVKIMDTRKTIPGLRLAQKYAVTVGGGYNQRLGLYDAVLIKENHIKSSKIMDDLLSLSLKYAKNKDVQIEVESLDQLEKAIEIGFKNILLDNFSIKSLKKAVFLNKKRAILEASGNITLKNVKKIALTGVNRISLGSLTKNIKAIDLSMKIETFKSL